MCGDTMVVKSIISFSRSVDVFQPSPCCVRACLSTLSLPFLSMNVFVCVCIRAWQFFCVFALEFRSSSKLLRFYCIFYGWCLTLTHTFTSYDYKSLMNSDRKTIRIYPKLIKIRSALIDRSERITLRNTYKHIQISTTQQCCIRYISR